MRYHSVINEILREITANLKIYETLRQQRESMFAQFAQVAQQLNEQLSLVNQINLSVQVPEIYSAILKVDTSSLIKAIDVSQEISRLIADSPWQDAAQRIRESTIGLDAITERLSIDFSAYRIAVTSISPLDIFGNLQRLIQFDREAIAAFKAAGWPIAPSMPKDLIERIVEFHQRGRTRYVSRVIMGYYHRDKYRNLNAMVDSWRDHPLYNSRMHIIDDALDAHRSGKYTLSIPALLSQIEGVLNDYVHLNNLPARCGKIQQVYDAAIGDIDSYSFSGWTIANTLLYQLQTNTYAYTDFEEELSRSVNNRKTTRHTVLHGVSINYHRPIHSLKAFVLLDAVSALIELNER